MKNRKRRFMALLLCAAIMLTLMPMMAMAEPIVGPVMPAGNVCVASYTVDPQEGTLAITIGDRNVGIVTLEKAPGGWYISKGGAYIGQEGGKLTTSEAKGEIWKYSYGKFFQTESRSVSRGWTILNILFGRKIIASDYYLASNGGEGFTVNSTAFDANVVLTKTVSKATHTEGWRCTATGEHEKYCVDCKKSLGKTGTCTYENGSCILCGAQDPNVTGLFDISVKLHSHNFLFFRLYTADVFVSSEITGIKSVELSPNGPLDFHKGKILSTKPISEVYIAITTFENDVYVYKYNAKTQIVSSYDMLK